MNTNDVLYNKYSLVKGAARRARQLQGGALPMIATKSMKACRVAQDEIRQGQVSYSLPVARITDVGPVGVPGVIDIRVRS